MTRDPLLSESFEVLFRCFISLGSSREDIKAEMSPALFAEFMKWKDDPTETKERKRKAR